MSTARIPDGTPLGLVQVGLAANGSESTVKCLYCLRPYPGDGTFAHHQDWCPLAGRSDPPVKPTSEVAHQPGQQPAADPWWCDCPDRKGPHVHMCNWDADSRYSMILTALVDTDAGLEIPGTRR